MIDFPGFCGLFFGCTSGGDGYSGLAWRLRLTLTLTLTLTLGLGLGLDPYNPPHSGGTE